MANELEPWTRHIEVLRDWKANIGGEGTADEHAALDAAIAALQQALQPRARPAAWLHRQGNHTEASGRQLDADERARGWTQEPLYAGSPPPPLPEGVSEEDVLLAAATWRAGATFREILESFLTRLKTTNVG